VPWLFKHTATIFRFGKEPLGENAKTMGSTMHSVLKTKATKPRSAYYGLLHMILFWQYGYLLFAKYE